MRPRKEQSEEKKREKRPGAFYAGGQFDDDAFEGQRGHVDALVRALVKDRRVGKLSPLFASRRIEAGNAAGAFPHWQQWAGTTSWAMCLTSTSAEEAVKREGRGIDGHWCGERWMWGSERDCHDPRHRERVEPAEAKALIDMVIESLK